MNKAGRRKRRLKKPLSLLLRALGVVALGVVMFWLLFLAICTNQAQREQKYLESTGGQADIMQVLHYQEYHGGE